jgi:PhnB protein
LNFNGNCEAAFKFYTEALNGTIEAMVPHEGTPAGAHVPAEWSKKIPLTPRLSVGITLLMGSDAPVDRYQKPQGFSVSLQTTTPEEAERAFNGSFKKRERTDAKTGNLFRDAVRHAGGSVRYSMDD